MSDKYILVGEEVVSEPDLLKWGEWFHTADRHVDHTVFDDGSFVSTVFIGLDHQFGPGPPLVFETMVFDKEGHGGECERCSTLREAQVQHVEVCNRVLQTKETEK